MFSFLIPSCLRNDIHKKQLERCIDSIRQFHDEKIYIINDSDDDLYYNEIGEKYNTIVVKSLHRGCAEKTCFKFISENSCFNNYFIMHDSMILLEKLENVEMITNIKFLWHFTNHRIHWDNIIEERTEYNIKNNIVTHTDLLKHHIMRDYDTEFQLFAIDYLNNKDKWCGCMGFCCITNKKTILHMNSIVPFVEIFLKSSDRRNRVVNESIFSILCHFIFRETNFTDSYDGLYYDGITINIYHGQPTGFDNLRWNNKNKYIGKISFLR